MSRARRAPRAERLVTVRMTVNGKRRSARVLTVEGLARDGTLGALQRAFVEMGGAQCGICTPGMLLSAHELLARAKGVPGEDAVREALAGNLCRCTGYQKIVDAVRAAARARRAKARA